MRMHADEKPVVSGWVKVALYGAPWVIFVMVACGAPVEKTEPVRRPVTVEATPAVPALPGRWGSADTIHLRDGSYWTEITEVCDFQTGHRLYVVRGTEAVGVAVVPGDCKEEKK